MSEFKNISDDYNRPACFEDKELPLAQECRVDGFIMPAPPTFKDVIRIAEEVKTPMPSLMTLFAIVGREEVVKGLWSQGEDKFKETLLVFCKVGTRKCIKYINILNDNKVIGQTHISRDFAKAPYSIARVFEFIDNRKIEIIDLTLIVPQLRNLIGERSFEKGFSSWSLYYFFVTVEKVKAIGIDKSISIVLMLKELFGQKYVGEAYEHGYLWFVEAIEMFSQIGVSKSKSLIEDFRDRSNVHYFNIAFAHNPRSFARYIKLKSESPDREVGFIIAEKKVSSGEIVSLLHDLLEEFFSEKECLSLASSELIAFVFDAVTKYLEGEKHEKIAVFLRNKYFSDLSKKNVYLLLRGIGPEIEVQKDLKTYDVEAAHMVAFFFLVETSGDGLIEFPLGPAYYHGTLSEIVHTMSKVSIGEDFLIPRKRVIPLDVSISIPPKIIHKREFKRKATLLRVVNDLLYTAEVRLATAFKSEPQDQSGVRFKEGRAKDIGGKGPDLVENRSGNLITDAREESIDAPLVAHKASFQYYQMMYSALVACFSERSKEDDFEKKLADLYVDYERQVLGILKDEKIEYLTNITSNENQAFLELSYARTAQPNVNVRLGNVVKHSLSLIDEEILRKAVRSRIEQLRNHKKDVEFEIKAEIKIQKDIDNNYGSALEVAFQELLVRCER